MRYLILLTGVNNAKFRQPVVPGDTLIYEVEVVKNRKSFYWFKAIGKVDGKIEDMGYILLSIMTIEGIRCAGGSCTVKNMVAVETRERKWSVADDWKDANGNGVPPQAG